MNLGKMEDSENSDRLGRRITNILKERGLPTHSRSRELSVVKLWGDNDKTPRSNIYFSV